MNNNEVAESGGDGVYDSQDFPEEELAPEPDMENDLHTQEVVHVEDEQEMETPDYTELMKNVSYLDIVKAAMDLFTTTGVSENDKTTSRVMLHCPACLEDDTLDEDWKTKLWRRDVLKRHIFIKFHSPFVKLK